MTKNLRALFSISALALSVGLASSPAAFAQDKMGKDAMAKACPTHVQGWHEKGRCDVQGRHEKHDAMAKDGMSKDNMKKYGSAAKESRLGPMRSLLSFLGYGMGQAPDDGRSK